MSQPYRRGEVVAKTMDDDGTIQLAILWEGREEPGLRPFPDTWAWDHVEVGDWVTVSPNWHQMGLWREKDVVDEVTPEYLRRRIADMRRDYPDSLMIRRFEKKLADLES